jgi:hypothetical protein
VRRGLKRGPIQGRLAVSVIGGTRGVIVFRHGSSSSRKQLREPISGGNRKDRYPAIDALDEGGTMKKLMTLAAILAALAVPAGASAFHHTGLPSTACANANAGSPSNDNGQAKEAITAHNPAQDLPLPPVGTPGNGQGDGGEHCAGATG